MLNVGDRALVQIDSSQHKGLPHRRYNGKVGLVTEVGRRHVVLDVKLGEKSKTLITRGIFVQASLERMMKCGIGICGSCCVNDDLACRDGTIFDGDHLSTKSEFGHFHRTKSGILEEI